MSRPGDKVITTILAALTALAAVASVVLSFFFVMATDSCGPQTCDAWKLTAAYVVTWGGAVLGVIAAIAGAVRAARREKPMWVWPALGLLLIIAGFVIGSQLAVWVSA